MNHSFTILGIPLQDAFENFFKKQNKYCNWKEIDTILQENPGIQLTDTMLETWCQKIVAEFDTCTTLQFCNAYKKLISDINVCSFHERINTTINNIISLKTRNNIAEAKKSKSNLARDLNIMAYIIQTQDNSEEAQTFLTTQPNVWTKITAKDAIDAEVVFSIIPFIKNDDIKKQMTEYAMLRLCKQDKLDLVSLWKDIDLSIIRQENLEYFQNKFSKFISENLNKTCNEDVIINIFNQIQVLKIKSKYYIPILKHAVDNGLENILAWFGEHKYDLYRRKMIHFSTKNITAYPLGDTFNYTADDILHSFDLTEDKIPEWCKSLTSLDKKITLINDIYLGNIDNYHQLDIDYILLFGLITLSENAEGVNKVLTKFLNKNSVLFSALKNEIIATNDVNIQKIIIYHLAGGLDKLKNYQLSLNALFETKNIGYIESWPIKYVKHNRYSGTQYHVFEPQKVFTHSTNNNESIYERNLMVLKSMEELRNYIHSYAFSQDEIELIF